MKRLLTTTAVGLMLAAAPALAQTSQEPSSPAAPQTEQSKPGMSTPDTSAPSANPAAPDASDQATKPDMSKPDTAQSDTLKSTDTARSDTGSGSASLGGETLASNLIGATVTNASGENIGEINDIVFDEEGKAKSALIGVGGFLGMGEKNVAVEFSELNFRHDENNKLTVNVAMSAETLQAMPAYTKPGEESSSQTEPMKNQERVPQGSESTPPATSGSNTNR